jgi:Protein of unknown function (DUF1236)
MRSKILMISTAALLAGTLAAAGQSIQPGGGAPAEKEKGVQSNQIPKGGQMQRSEDRQGQAQRDQDKSKVESQGQAQRDQDKSKTQGQAQREPDKSKSQTQGQVERDQDKTKSQPQRDPDRTQQGAREGERGGGNVSFSTEQRTKIRETVLKEKNAPRVSKVDFSIREGTVVPRTVRVVEIPDVIVEIHPEWRGYKYFLVNEELVVVDPATLRIVAVIDV